MFTRLHYVGSLSTIHGRKNPAWTVRFISEVYRKRNSFLFADVRMVKQKTNEQNLHRSHLILFCFSSGKFFLQMMPEKHPFVNLQTQLLSLFPLPSPIINPGKKNLKVRTRIETHAGVVQNYRVLFLYLPKIHTWPPLMDDYACKLDQVSAEKRLDGRWWQGAYLQSINTAS